MLLWFGSNWNWIWGGWLYGRVGSLLELVITLLTESETAVGGKRWIERGWVGLWERVEAANRKSLHQQKRGNKDRKGSTTEREFEWINKTAHAGEAASSNAPGPPFGCHHYFTCYVMRTYLLFSFQFSLSLPPTYMYDLLPGLEPHHSGPNLSIF